MEFRTETLRGGLARIPDILLRNFTSRALIRKSQSSGMGGRSFNDSICHLSQVGELKHEEGAQDAITELESLMRGPHIGRNSSDNLRISGYLNDIIATRLYGKNKNRQLIWKIAKIKKSLIDFANQVKHEKHWRGKQYQEKKKEIAEKVRKLKLRGRDLHIRWGG